MTHQPDASVFARTGPLVIERHYFGEHRKASLLTVQTEADKALLALTKRLIKMPETATIRQHDSKFRQYLATMGTPFKGLWLIPVGAVELVHKAAQTWEAERQVLAELAAAAYPLQVAAMREPLGPLFNPLDYPPVSVFKASYWVDWRFVDFGVPNILKELRAEVFQQEKEKLAKAGQKAKEMIEQHLAGQLLEITEHLSDLLTPRANGRKPALRDGALDRLVTYLDTIALRDVTGFHDLQAITARLKQTAVGLTVEDLREDANLRQRAAEALTEAKEAVSALVTEETRRGIRVRDDEEVA